MATFSITSYSSSERLESSSGSVQGSEECEINTSESSFGTSSSRTVSDQSAEPGGAKRQRTKQSFGDVDIGSSDR